MIKWIAFLGVVMVILALTYLHLMDAWTKHAAIAVSLGVFLSVLLGCGLFSLAFFSNKSGHDDEVRDSTMEHKDS